MTHRLSQCDLSAGEEAARGPFSATRTVRDPAIRRRAIVRIAILAVLVSQIITTAFAFVVYRNHPDVALGMTTMFSFGLCVLLSVWIRSDAKYAYQNACDLGYVSSLAGKARSVRIARGCPRRWLAVLHIELQGRMVVN